ncbi:CHAT domain-containing protein [Suillus clintonianus]|uniref:CHAT domain-containing protein n=1 Tax=Suillus clintonianus TaxID=1904413 RepID=UPI001B8710F0|nr:CHAT domain-containing protein [Suillus clintonianus]KAG2124866.1 CHAT domain-containing protein [Suillus clintonianus]
MSPEQPTLVCLGKVLGPVLPAWQTPPRVGCFSHMSNFVPHPLDDRPPPLEELSHPERPQDPETNFVINEILQVAVNTVGEEASHQEHPRGVQQVVITAIRATDLTLGLRRIPAGFHVVVKADGIECQTSNKPVHVDQVVVEWNEQILLPCEPSSLVRVSVYASFELDPMLCHGEVLRTFNISVGELLDRSEKSPIIFRAKQHEVVSSYTSLFMKVEQRCSDENADAVVCPHTTLTSGDMDLSVLETDTGHRLLAQYRRMKDNGDLDQSIKHFERALDFFPVEHPCRPAALFNLATAKFVSHQAIGTYLDLDIPITLFEDALEFRPDGHADRPITQLHLAIALLFRFAKQGSETDADAAEELLSDVLDVCHSNSHIYRAALLAIDTFALHGAGGKGGRDLDQKQPTAFMIPLSPDQLARRVEWCSYRDDSRELDEVISLHYDALRYYGTMHDCREQLQCNLGVMLYIRYNRRGNNQDLDEAITRLREALDVSSVGRAHRSKSSNNLANMLYTRFQHRGNDQDLDDAIMLHRDALTLHSVGHPDRSSSLSNLGSVLYIRFQHRGNDQDLDDAIKLYRDALALRPLRDNDQDSYEAIMLHRGVLASRPVGHPDRLKSLYNLGTALFTCFQHRGNHQDLDEAIMHLRAAVYLLFPRSGLDGTGEDTDSQTAAMHHLKAAANVVSAGLLPRLQASLRWARDADQHSHDTALEAYANSMQLLDAFMSATASVSSRHSVLKKFSNRLAMDAASCALRSGDVCRAVELLEQGRTVIWSQMTQIRTPLDNLQDRGDHAVALMKKFKELNSLLDTLPTNHPERTPGVDVDAEAIRSRPLDAEASRVVEKIRKIEGFSRFLLPPLFSYLQYAACDGPVVVLVASKSSCDAIIVPHNQPPMNIKLRINLEKLQHLVVKLQRASQPQAAPKPAPETTPKSAPKSTHLPLMKALTELWDDVVRPVVDNLGGFAPPGSRIWWCPSGAFNFLPLHAAGAYRRGGQLLSKLYISSYTPSLTALIRARRSHDRSLPVSFVAIGQNHPPGHKIPLAGVEPELDLVRDLLPPPPTVSFTKIMSVDATKSRASRALRDNTWIHFACHGTQNFDEPFDSAFLMRDQPLSLLDISQMDLSRHEFAFLSACETAVGNPHTPDEVIHLAASLQFAGIKSVVGTLWEVNDDTVQHLVKAFYNKFCGDGKMDSKRAARALHRAVQSLASDKDLDMPLDQRIVFMHVGI